jgi:hypothetical protein
MIRQFFRHGLIWLVIIFFVFQMTTDLFSKPKRATTTTLNESDNPFASKGKGSNKDEKVVVSQPPAPVDPNAVILTGMLDHSVVEVVSCFASGSDLVINGTITNQGVDGEFEFNVRQYEESTKIYDDLGNKVNISSLQLANLESDSSYLRVKMISGVKANFTARFKGMPTVGGETQARTVKVFELRASGFKCQFRNIKIQHVGEKATPVPTPVVTPSPNAIAAPALDTNKGN